MKPIRVLIVDDHTLFRSGIKLLLERQAGFEVVGEASDGLEGVKRAKQLKPDVVLLDLHMPGTGGLAAVPLLREEVPQTEVIMLTVSEDADDLLEALRAGARGYLLKNIETDFLLDSIRRAAAGESVISTHMAGKLADAMRNPQNSLAKAESSLGKLTPREREIIVMLASGASNKEVARTLDLAESTVKIHVQGILRKLNLSSRVQAAVYAVEHGLVDSSY
ncbi:response regulator transcription factor [Methylotenera sp.]|uniref:response regulator n=1 Tax=Methylotenera sp. TaxID=2051956 RepID=UPI00271F8378|nr:response regulator transcription factor [Methylotenera sp.]MDO9394622.1 response regulator transcription factor [Methylotenera sp.]MDP1522481.1 response regulator transcription factor [Methylotenera sp.]MDP2071404.1 response regulator transcription factor [Methylotenera sp.]MDP3005365.1 response regulator transcription factor [Methylotenera sp.]MDP3307306.1 response regulator transcription factor [Methylotenera sp.]